MASRLTRSFFAMLAFQRLRGWSDEPFGLRVEWTDGYENEVYAPPGAAVCVVITPRWRWWWGRLPAWRWVRRSMEREISRWMDVL